MKSNVQKSLMWALVASEASHVFCCVMPTVFSIVSLMVGMGMAATMPGFLTAMHDTMHHWELPIIGFSGVILLAGWGITWYSDRVDCHHTGCEHDACAPKKNRAHLVLFIATVLFLFNLSVYLFAHRSTVLQDFFNLPHEQHETHDSVSQ